MRGREGVTPQLPWLPGEQFEVGLDARYGLMSQPPTGPEVLSVTSYRVVRSSQAGGKTTTGLVPLDRLSGVEVINAHRPWNRLVQGLLLLGVGGLLGLGTWAVLEAWLLVLLAGGVPTLVGIYILAGYAFPDEEGALLLHAGGYIVRMPLRSASARRDAYLVAHLLMELMSAASRRSAEPTVAELSEPMAAGPHQYLAEAIGLDE